MNTDIEWLFDEVYRRKENPNEHLYFLSDWDCDIEENTDFNIFLIDAFSSAASNSFKYVFAYEKLNVKLQITNFCDQLYRLYVSQANLTILPSATHGIYLSLKALSLSNVNRYLVFTPGYFSLFESLKENKSLVYYYHLNDTDNFSIDFDKLEKIITEQFIECVIITDPVFSAGIEFAESDYKKLCSIAERLNIYLFIDYSLGGLMWNQNNLYTFNHPKLRWILQSNKYIFIDSLSKRLQLNGIKFSIVFASSNIIDQIESLSDITYGGLNNIQIEIIERLYRVENNKTVLSMHNNQLTKIKSNFRMLQTLLNGEPFSLADSNSGFFSILLNKHKSFDEVNTEQIILSLLKEENVIAIPNNRFSYFSNNKFGLRINLNKNREELLIAFSKSIRHISNRLYC